MQRLLSLAMLLLLIGCTGGGGPGESVGVFGAITDPFEVRALDYVLADILDNDAAVNCPMAETRSVFTRGPDDMILCIYLCVESQIDSTVEYYDLDLVWRRVGGVYIEESVQIARVGTDVCESLSTP